MAEDQRRDEIVRAVLPLVAEYGAAVTTSQIARAAGIGEATIFRVFKDKNSLLDACAAEALRPGPAIEQIGVIELGQPLHARLREAVSVLEAHLLRMGRVVAALDGSGYRSSTQGDGNAATGTVEHSRKEGFSQTRGALTELFVPDQEDLCLPAEELATLFVGLVLARVRPVSGSPEDVADLDSLIHLFLYGAFRSGTPRN